MVTIKWILLVVLLIYVSSVWSITPGTAQADKGSSSSVSLIPSFSGMIQCTSSSKCKEIDQVWLSLNEIIGGDGRGVVWDPSLQSWKSFDQVYPTDVIKSISSLASGPASSSAYDGLIVKYSKEANVNPIIIKAIIEHESDFNPNAISPTGCSGLMQVCGGSADPDVIQVQCSQQKKIGPKMCINCHDWTESGKTKYFNGKALRWCDECPENNPNCQDDDRFNSEKNIRAGVSLFKKHLSNCKEDLTCALTNFAGVSVGGAKSTYASEIIAASKKFENIKFISST